MLEGVFIVADIVVIVIGIGKEGIAGSEDIARRQVGRRQLCTLWVFDDEYFFVVIAQVLT